MQFGMIKHVLFAVLAIFLATSWTGCGGSSERPDRRDERDPLIMRGDARKRAGDVDGAIELYLQALDRRPNLALAHLKLAVEYDEQKRDYLRAIFHYSRYLELRPRAQKNELVEELIRMAHVSYLASLPNPPPGAVERVAMLQRENDRLKHQVEELTDKRRALETQLAAARRPSAPVDESVAAPRTTPADTPPAGSADAPRTYRVERGDTLSRIAAKVYDDHNKWPRIFEANRAVLPNPQSLREGQVLVIP